MKSSKGTDGKYWFAFQEIIFTWVTYKFRRNSSAFRKHIFLLSNIFNYKLFGIFYIFKSLNWLFILFEIECNNRVGITEIGAFTFWLIFRLILEMSSNFWFLMNLFYFDGRILWQCWYFWKSWHVVEHCTQLMVEAFHISSWLISFFFLNPFSFLLFFGLNSEVIFFGERIVVWNFQ